MCLGCAITAHTPTIHVPQSLLCISFDNLWFCVHVPLACTLILTHTPCAYSVQLLDRGRDRGRDRVLMCINNLLHRILAVIPPRSRDLTTRTHACGKGKMSVYLIACVPTTCMHLCANNTGLYVQVCTKNECICLRVCIHAPKRSFALPRATCPGHVSPSSEFCRTQRGAHQFEDRH